MELRAVRPLGTFHARKTRDAAALDRDGQTFVLLNMLPTSGHDQTAEIMFDDGVWMLASLGDLEMR
jgi:hypothetical protein